MKVEIIMYHYVRDLKNSRYPGIKGLDLELFRKQIDFLSRHYEFVSMEEVMEAHYDKKSLPENAVLLTFDDGYSDHYANVFPILMQKKIKGFFAMPGKILKEKKVLDVNKIHFILASAESDLIKEKLFDRLDHYRGREFDIPDNDTLLEKITGKSRYDDKDTVFIKRMLQAELPERLRNLITQELFREFVTDNEKAFVEELYLSYDQIKMMKNAGMCFGIHGYEHYHFDETEPEVFKPDLLKAIEVFDGIIDPDKWVFCYPYGGVSDQLQTYSISIGCVAGLTCEARTAFIGQEDIYRLPRYDTNDYPPKRAVPKSFEI